jgi:hypothetical protein
MRHDHKKGREIMKTIGWILGTVIFLWVSGIEAKDFQFPEISAWKKSGETETFIPKTLYEYINGAADLYLAYDFQELKVAEYQNGKKASVTVEVYRHKTPGLAFGIYSQERLPSANFMDVGTQGYIENNVFNFLAGPFYVKISSYNTGAEDKNILLAFARKVSENLGEKGALPLLLTAFPKEGMIKNSEKFIAQNFLGYSFLHSAFTADYELSNKKFTLFVIATADRVEGKNMIQKYIQQIEKTEKPAAEGCHLISDPYHGEVDLCWKGGTLLGINTVRLKIE